MRVLIASAALGVALLGISWAQHPASVSWGVGVAYAAPQEFDDFAWDNQEVPAYEAAGLFLVP